MSLTENPGKQTVGIITTIEDKWQYIRDMFPTGKQHVQLISVENTLSPFAKPLHDHDHDHGDDGDDGDDGVDCDDVDDDHGSICWYIFWQTRGVKHSGTTGGGETPKNWDSISN